jgi:hypothetical protein
VTLKRIRIYATLMAVTLWTVVAIDYGTPGPLDRFGKPKGTDFLHFYVIGSLVREGRTDLLYDMDAQTARSRSIAQPKEETRYVPIESPLIALIASPFTVLPYNAALSAWILFIAIAYGASCWLLWTSAHALQRFRREALVCCVAFPGIYATVLHGQVSFVALLAVCAALAALERDRKVAAGLALATLVFKPHWIVAAGGIFLVAREWRVVMGIAVGTLAMLALMFAAVGRAVVADYYVALRSIAQIGDLLEPRAAYSARSLFTVFVPSPTLATVLYAVTALAIVAKAARVWRSDARFDVRASAVVLGMTLVSPHVFEYDLLLLGPVFFFFANALADGQDAGVKQSPFIQWALAFLFVLPLATPVPAPIRVPLSVGVMAAVLYGMKVNFADPLTLFVSPSSEPPTGRARVVIRT